MSIAASSRLLSLLALLQQRREWSGPELAERLEVGPRTVRRDVEKLRDLGYPIDAAPGVAGGYRLGAGTHLPPLLFDEAEAVAVVLGLRSAASGSIAGAEETAARALTKLDQIFPARLRARIKALDSTASGFAFDGPAIDPDLIVSLGGACRDRVDARFLYAARDGRRSRREVEPNALVHSGRRWYLVAFDLDRGAWRTFRVDRIVGTPTIGNRSKARREVPGGSPQDFVEVSLVSWGETPAAPGRVRIHAPAGEVARRLPSHRAKVEAEGDESCVVVSVGGWTRQFLVWLALLGHDVTALEPPELVAEARALASRLH